ncbi:MAG: ABC transporter substrate-binding protein [Pseudomonadota bacterium]
MESLTAEGPDRLVFRLKRPIPYFPKAVSYYGSPIVAPETVYEDGKMSGLIGTGPFSLGAVKPADSLEVLAFDDYWGGRPAFDRVVFRTIPDADSRLMALTAGQIDAIVDFGGIFPHQLPELLRTPGLESDPHHRRNLYRRLCELMNQHLPMLPLYHDVAVYAYRDRKEIARKIQIVWQDPVIYLNLFDGTQ